MSENSVPDHEGAGQWQVNISAPSPAKTTTLFLINTVIFLAISRQTYAYIARGGKGSVFRTVLCLWLLNAVHFVSDMYGLYAAHSVSSKQVSLPPHKAIGALASLLFAVLCIYFSVLVILWKQLYTMTGRNRLYASVVTLAVMIQGTYIPKLGTNFTLTHVLAVTQTGFHGATRALALPKDQSSSNCPRLRVPLGLAPSPHSSRSRRYLTASLMCAANAMLLYGLYKVVDITLQKLPTGDAMSYLYSCFSDVYTIVYLSILARHSVVDRGGPHLGFAIGRDQLELEERHMANDIDAQGAELS